MPSPGTHHNLLVRIIKSERLLEREKVLGTVMPGERLRAGVALGARHGLPGKRLRDRLDAGLAVAQTCQRCTSVARSPAMGFLSRAERPLCFERIFSFPVSLTLLISPNAVKGIDW